MNIKKVQQEANRHKRPISINTMRSGNEKNLYILRRRKSGNRPALCSRGKSCIPHAYTKKSFLKFLVSNIASRSKLVKSYTFFITAL